MANRLCEYASVNTMIKDDALYKATLFVTYAMVKVKSHLSMSGVLVHGCRLDSSRSRLSSLQQVGQLICDQRYDR